MALQLEYRGSNYFISEEELNNTSITEMSAYLDEDLSEVADMDGGVLIFKKGQLEETTMASSAGPYVPTLTAGVVRRKIDVGRSYDMKQAGDNKIVKGFELKKPIGKIFSLGLKENILNKIIFDKVKLVMEEDRTFCEDPNDGEYFCLSGSDNLGTTDLYKGDGKDIIHKFGDYHLSDVSPEEEETYSIPGTKKVKKTVFKPALHKEPFNISVSLAEEKIDLYPKFTKKELDNIINKDNINEEELEETTTAASGAAGSYVTPQMWAKNRRNWRMAAKPTWKGGSFVKFKDRCIKYNNKKWCSQGAVDKPIELVSTLMEAATKLSEETGKEVDYIAQLMSKRYSAPNEHLSDEVIEMAKENGYEVYAGVGQTEFTKQPNDGIELEITVDGINGDIHAMIHNLEDNTFSGKTFDRFEDAIEYLENI